MIKSTMTEIKVSKEKEYPYLGISVNTVVLFIAPNKGTVVHPPKDNSHRHLGEYGEDWEENMFTSYFGEVKITSNK
jgi:hypothetical protein